MKKTVILDGPGTVRGRAKDRVKLHDAVDWAFDRKAKDVRETREELEAEKMRLEAALAVRRAKGQNSNRILESALRMVESKLRGAKDGFRPRTTPAPSKKYESFLDLVKKAKEKTAGMKDADLSQAPNPQAVLDRKALHEKVKKLPIAEQKNISELSKGGTPFLDAVREVLNRNGVGDAKKIPELGDPCKNCGKPYGAHRGGIWCPGSDESKWKAKDSENKSIAPMVKVIPRSRRPMGKDAEKDPARELLRVSAFSPAGLEAEFYELHCAGDPSKLSRKEIIKAILKKRFGKTSKDSDLNPFERDTDAGAAKIVKREAKAGLSVDAIVKKYGFSKSFVEEEMPKRKTTDLQPV